MDTVIIVTIAAILLALWNVTLFYDNMKLRKYIDNFKFIQFKTIHTFKRK